MGRVAELVALDQLEGVPEPRHEGDKLLVRVVPGVAAPVREVLLQAHAAQGLLGDDARTGVVIGQVLQEVHRGGVAEAAIRQVE